jgi:hypothetical protein
VEPDVRISFDEDIVILKILTEKAATALMGQINVDKNFPPIHLERGDEVHYSMPLLEVLESLDGLVFTGDSVRMPRLH